MLSLLSSSEASLWVADWRFYLMIAVVASTLLAGLAMWLVKSKANKNYMKPYAITACIVNGLAVLSVIVGSLVLEFKKGSFGASYSAWVGAGVLIFILASVLIICLIDRKRSEKNNTVALVYAAVCIAMSFALSYVKFFEMPQGGSITLAALLPIAFYSYVFGAKRGIVCCFIYGILQMIQDPFLAHPIQVLLDYPLAFLFVGLSGVFKKSLKKYPQLAIALGMLIGICTRYLCHVVSGSVFFASYAPEGMNPWIYSLTYNSFVFIDGLISIAAGVLLLSSKQILREVTRIEGKYLPSKGLLAAAENSTTNIDAVDNSKVNIDAVDNSKVNIDALDNASVNIDTNKDINNK